MNENTLLLPKLSIRVILGPLSSNYYIINLQYDHEFVLGLMTQMIITYT